MIFPALVADMSMAAVTKHTKPCVLSTTNGLVGSRSLTGARPGSLRTEGTLVRSRMGRGAQLAGRTRFTCEARLPQVDVDHTQALAARLGSCGQSQLAVVGGPCTRVILTIGGHDDGLVRRKFWRVVCDDGQHSVHIQRPGFKPGRQVVDTIAHNSVDTSVGFNNL